ncbi:MAG: hypothetical protein JRJ11_15840 [Deltaproteobacteria bacterium]|nr:hypothetical protein [Deltaproteobacteria bacterium]MBW2169974.1 hypothetical protein [Deltaproteobacteria bacterium]
MTHEDTGHYAKKHSPDRKVQPEIAKALKQKASNREISCAAAHKIARDLKVSPAEVGFTTDTLEIRIVKCQMGLYGYQPEKRVVKPAKTVSQTLEEAICDSLVGERLSCRAAWDIAKRSGTAKMAISSACETLKIKISSCQLGSF